MLDYERAREQVLDEVKRKFRPELLNRFDKIVVFKPLGAGEIKQIVELQLQSLMQRLIKQKITLDVVDPAKVWLTERGFEPELGARPVRRLIQTMIEDPLAEGILNKTFTKGSVVKVEPDTQELKLSPAENSQAASTRRRPRVKV